MEKLSKNLIIGILVVVVVGYFYISRNRDDVTTNEKIMISTAISEKTTIPSFTDYGQTLGEDIINCEFKVTSNFVYKNNEDGFKEENRKVYYNTDIATEGKQNLITFAGLSTKQPKIKGNMGDSPLSILKNDSETVVLAEQNMMGDVFIYTIFKKEKVATWHKSYKMLVAPYSMLSMGYCY